MMNATDFTRTLESELSPLVRDQRTVTARFKSSRGFTSRPHQSLMFVNFYNLPEARHHEKRGGGAESENNRMMFMVSGFDEDESAPVEKLKVELSNSVFPRTYHLRAKTASPEKVTSYVADFINKVAAENEPSYTHE